MDLDSVFINAECQQLPLISFGDVVIQLLMKIRIQLFEATFQLASSALLRSLNCSNS